VSDSPARVATVVDASSCFQGGFWVTKPPVAAMIDTS